MKIEFNKGIEILKKIQTNRMREMKKSELSIAMESLINRMDKVEEKISGYENEI